MLKINHSLSLLAALIGLLPINHVFSDVGLAPQSAPAAQRVVASSADQSQRRADWAALTPEQRDQKRAERKAKRSLMSPAAREQFKAERRAQLNGLSASDRERRMTQRRAFQSGCKSRILKSVGTLLPEWRRRHLRRAKPFVRPARQNWMRCRLRNGIK